MCDPLITENSNPPSLPTPYSHLCLRPTLTNPGPGPRVTVGALGHQGPRFWGPNPHPTCRGPRVIKLTTQCAVQSFTGWQQAPMVIPWESYFSIVNTAPRADYPSTPHLRSVKAYWEQFWVNLNLSSLYYSAEPLISTQTEYSFFMQHFRLGVMRCCFFGRSMNILRLPVNSLILDLLGAVVGCNSSVMPEQKMLLKFHRLPIHGQSSDPRR